MVKGISLDEVYASTDPIHVLWCWDAAYCQFMGLVNFDRPLLPNPTSVYRLVSYT